jgi:hypothetical protein
MKRPIFKCKRCRRRPQRPPWDICAQCRAEAIGKGMRRTNERKAEWRVPAKSAGTPLPPLAQLIAEPKRNPNGP